MKKTVVFQIGLMIVLLGLILLGQRPAVAEPNELEELDSGSYPRWTQPAQLTTAALAPNGARLPVVAAAPNGTIIVGFLIQASGNEQDTDLYYRTTSNNGSIWSPALSSSPSPIHVSPGVRSTELDVAYSSNNVPLAVWREGNNDIRFARQQQWASNGFFELTTGTPSVNGPRIAASGVTRVNVVWAETSGGQFFIRFRRSLNNGNDNFPVTGQLVRPDITARPAMVVADNTVHLVWEEGIFTPFSGAKIYYARGTVNEGTNSVSWAGPIQVSHEAPPAIVNAKQPDIVLEGTTLHVTYVNRESQTEQAIYQVECAADCLDESGWQSTGNISGQFVSVHASDPYDLVSALAAANGCTMAYFHGLIDPNPNEQILGTSSCGNWAQSAQDIVTPLQNRAINPRMATRNSWWIYLVYQEIQLDGDGDFLPPQIQFTRNDPALFLPVISKP